jgi:hypothetical protein
MSFKLKTLFSNKSLNIVVGLVSVLIALWVLMYLIPGLFISLFNTLLGNIILLGIILISFMKNKTMGVGLAAIFIIMYQFSHLKH